MAFSTHFARRRSALALTAGLLLAAAAQQGHARPAPLPAVSTPVLSVRGVGLPGKDISYGSTASVTLTNLPDTCTGTGIKYALQREVGAVGSDRWEDVDGGELKSSLTGPTATLDAGYFRMLTPDKGRRYRAKASGFFTADDLSRPIPIAGGVDVFSRPLTPVPNP